MEENKRNSAGFWKDISDDLWNDWKWQLRNRINTLDGLKEILNLTSFEIKGILHRKKRLPMAITPYIASLMDKEDPFCPIRMQFVPKEDESNFSDNDMVDPLGEDAHSPLSGLVHRYPDRVLLLATDKCATYCRYCTRERMVGSCEDYMSLEKVEEICNYIKKHPEIRDVIISGGDPLLLNKNKLKIILDKLKEIKHIEIIRIGTRVPVSLPQRIDKKLVNFLKQYHPLYISLHVTHPKEITPQMQKACNLFSDAGIPLGSQTVLLKGINDNAETLKKLFHELLKIRIKPYYLYQCDVSCGTSHFRTLVSKGIEIMDNLRGFTSGYAIPTFVIDTPGGGGKAPISPTYLVDKTENKLIIRNYENKLYEYTEINSKQFLKT